MLKHVALVTGASSGMGLIYARQLACRGYNLLIVSNQQPELIQTSADIADEYGVAVIPRYQDLAESNAAAELHEYCISEGLEIEVLINNAGSFFFRELHPDCIPAADKMMSLHMNTVTRMSLLFGEDMRKRHQGYILIMSSMAAKLPTPGISIYSATKAYLKSFGKSLYFEMKPYGVGVTTVCPAAIATPLYGLKPSLMKLGLKTGVIRTPEWLVKKALRGMFRKRKLVRPGFMNIYLPALVRLLPERLEERIWKRLIQ